MGKNYINSVELQGRVGTVRIMPVGDCLAANFSLMTEHGYRTSEGAAVIEATWMNISAFERNGISLEGLTKGVMVNVQGRLRTNRYTSMDGVERIFTEVVASNLRVIE